MALTALSDEQVAALLEGLTLDELDDFRHVLADALHKFSTNTEADESGFYQQPHRISTLHPETQATTLYMPACGPEGMGCKGLAAPPNTPRRRSSLKPRAVVSLASPESSRRPSAKPITPTGVVTLFAPDGTPLGLVQAKTMTAFRTALGSACLLNRRNSVKTITVFGSGLQAYWHVRLALMMRGSTIKQVNVINRRFSANASGILKKFAMVPMSAKNREGWTQTKFSILTPTFHEYDRLLKEQIRSSDVIYCCTPSREELFDASILTSHEGRKKGRLIVAVGSYTPEMRELPEGLLAQATKSHDNHRHFHKHAHEAGVIVVDTLEGVLKEAGEFIAAKIHPKQLVELGELVMLQRLSTEESETETSGSQTPPSMYSESLSSDRAPSMSTVFSDHPRHSSRSSSPMSPSHGRKPPSPVSTSHERKSSSPGPATQARKPSSPVSPNQSRKSSFALPFRKGSTASTVDVEKKKDESLSHWLRDGTVVYKSVGLGVMDLAVGMHLVKLANAKHVGTRVPGF